MRKYWYTKDQSNISYTVIFCRIKTASLYRLQGDFCDPCLIWHSFPLDVPCFDFKSFYTVFCLFLCLTINWSGSKQVQIQLKGSNPAKKALGSRLKLSYRSTMSKSTGLWWICHLWRSLSQLNSQGGWKEVKNVKQIFLLSKVG